MVLLLSLVLLALASPATTGNLQDWKSNKETSVVQVSIGLFTASSPSSSEAASTTQNSTSTPPASSPSSSEAASTTLNSTLSLTDDIRNTTLNGQQYFTSAISASSPSSSEAASTTQNSTSTPPASSASSSEASSTTLNSTLSLTDDIKSTTLNVSYTLDLNKSMAGFVFLVRFVLCNVFPLVVKLQYDSAKIYLPRKTSISLESYGDCRYDSVTIYDGPPGSSLLQRICHSINRTFRSSSNVMTIVFITDGSIQNTGFEANYNTLTATNSMSEKCGDIMTGLQGEFQSTRSASPDSDYCVWYISVSSNYKIHLHFSNFQMKDSLSCRSFSLSVYDGTPDSPLLGELCDTTDRYFNSSSNSMSIVYTKRRDDTDMGLEFSVSYYTVFQNNSDVTLSCHSDYMKARISSRYLESLGYSSNNIFLNDPQCRPQNLSGWLEFHIPYQRCQTLKQVLNDTICYINTLFTYSMKAVVIHRKKLSLTLRCQMYRDTLVDSLYLADDTMENSLIEHGLYSANLTFFNSPSFIHSVNNYPYLVRLNQDLYLQATLETTDPALVLFLDTCVASPDPFDVSENVYYLISNGCPRVSDYRIFPSSSPRTLRFGFSAFSFLKLYSNVYIQCKLVVCKQYDRWSRCNQGCKPRHKRAVQSHHNHHNHVHAVAGPVKLLN
ncbi:deleted in malignant brain tumors 1 protein-like [Bufo bufo]|uniref:deleted in malignant brain tumors 1 protein-like n=1 Tax=Bufo bufo TaxID=8384 RepID=UPI001ABDC962|nr:deleted in malignant brain tumors 1 protein-like [Bufo bufo]